MTTSTPNAASGSVSDGAGELTPFEAEIVAVFADLVVLLGLPKSMGEIYGFIFASAEPPTFADIERKLGLSKGSVSQGLRALKALGAVRDAGATDELSDGVAEGEPKADEGRTADRDGRPLGGAGYKEGGPDALPTKSPTTNHQSAAPQARATRWVATTELRQLIGTLLRERLTPYLERQDLRMVNAKAALKAESTRISAKDFKALKQRLTKLQTWQSRARTVLPVIGKML